jgi:signal transduction histidine kinase
VSGRKPSYEEIKTRLDRAEAFIKAIKGSEIDAILGQEDVSFVRDRLSDERIRKIQEDLKQRVAERTVLLRSLAVKLTQAEHHERKRLAHLLHDHIQQLIAGAKLRLGILRSSLYNSGLTENIDAIEDLLKEAIDASRSLSIELSPPALFSSGLLPAMTWLASNMEEIHGLKVSLHCDDGVEPACENIRILIFQAVRELLFNVVKHADTYQAWVRITHHAPGSIHIRVWDNGCGLDKDAKCITAGTGFGLPCICERIEAIGGQFNLDTTAGKGLHIDIIAPLDSKEPLDISLNDILYQ